MARVVTEFTVDLPEHYLGLLDVMTTEEMEWIRATTTAAAVWAIRDRLSDGGCVRMNPDGSVSIGPSGDNKFKERFEQQRRLAPGRPSTGDGDADGESQAHGS